MGVLSVLVTWKMNFLCMFSIFCDFEAKVSQKCPNRSTLEKCQKRLGHMGVFGCFGHFLLVLFYLNFKTCWCFRNLVFCIKFISSEMGEDCAEKPEVIQ